MYEEIFTRRLIQLREAKCVSAREMSLKLGQNPGYINAIESEKTFPSMQGFLYICEYLEVTPSEFFDTESNLSQEIINICYELKKLSPAELKMISAFVSSLSEG